MILNAELHLQRAKRGSFAENNKNQASHTQ